jgi:hypothetical protein
MSVPPLTNCGGPEHLYFLGSRHAGKARFRLAEEAETDSDRSRFCNPDFKYRDNSRFLTCAGDLTTSPLFAPGTGLRKGDTRLVLMDKCFAEKRASKCRRSGIRRHGD